jgi:hypothetical protein
MALSTEQFLEWRSPRLGRSNPERLNNPVWEWLMRSSGLSAYAANEQFGGPSSLVAGPCWCFHRFGQSSTQLADGRVVLIAGEHEDHYDPDFYIYNDVVIRHPDDRIDIYGYPREIFPPTDFHSATLTDNRIVIIGRLGYPEDRKPGTTPVMVLDLDTFAISSVVTSGTPPGWLFEHEATLSEDGSSISIHKGRVEGGREDNQLVENIDDWRLHLSDWRWERLTQRPWQRWDIRRQERKLNQLFEIRQAVWSRDFDSPQEFERAMEQLSNKLGTRPNLDSLKKLYRPSVPHEVVPEAEDEYNVFRINVDGIVVRYVESMYSIQMTVEGILPQQIIDVLCSELIETLAALENRPYERSPL